MRLSITVLKHAVNEMSLLLRRAKRPLDGGLEFVEFDRLNEMLGEAGL